MDRLMNYWFPVARTTDVRSEPVTATLLDVPLVLWRDQTGVRAFQDLCIHRGARLSLGQVTSRGELTCAYHGWTYNGEGQCTWIPSIPKERGIPSKARAIRYACREQYGLVFVSLGEPYREIFPMPEWGLSGWRTYLLGPFHWQTGADRSTENFMDAAHLPWVHAGLLGNPENPPIIPSVPIEARGDDAYYFEIDSECSRRDHPGITSTNRLTYLVELPYTIYHDNISPTGERVVDLFFATPISAKESLRFMVVARNFALEEPDDAFYRFTCTVWEQDRHVVETQRPEEVPLDLAEEFHLRGPDDASVYYRRLMKRQGFAIA